eukprot:3281336-Pleurochrysis_carterae.AAC.2
MARVSPNKQLVDECSQSWCTDSSESENVGTHRTSRNTRSTEAPLASRARSERSPMTVQAYVRPSTPVTRSIQGLAFTKSSRRGCMCQVQPLSTTKAMLVSPGASRRDRDAELRRLRDANNALALVAGGRDVEGGSAASIVGVDGDRDEGNDSAEVGSEAAPAADRECFRCGARARRKQASITS